MFDVAVDQAAGLRRLFWTEHAPLIPAGCLVPQAQARRVVADMAAGMAPGDSQVQVLDRPALHRWLAEHPSEAQGALRLPDGPAAGGGLPGSTTLLFWLDDPVEMARWVQAQGGDRLLLILSHRRDAMMAQYAEIKHMAATTGIRRFGVLFADVEQAARGRETFLNLAGCTRRFLSVQLDIVVGSCRDEAGLRTWSGLSLAELAQFQWTSWSGAGMPALDGRDSAGGVAH